MEALLKQFEVTDDQLYTIKRRLVEEFDRGLKKDATTKDALQMAPTYITALPDGTGNYDVTVLETALLQGMGWVVYIGFPTTINSKFFYTLSMQL